MKLAFDSPEDHKVIDLAPRVQRIGGSGEYGWGYAVCLVSAASMAAQGLDAPGCVGGVRVAWDDEGGTFEDVDSREILFKA